MLRSGPAGSTVTATIVIYEIPKEVCDPANDTGHNQEEAIIESPTPSVVYELPELNGAVLTGYRVISRAHPVPKPRPYVPNENTTTLPGKRLPFRTDTENGIMTVTYIFNVRYNDPLGQEEHVWQECYVLCAPIDALLSRLPSATDKLPLTVPWSDWAHQTRLVIDRPRRNWYSHTYGYRFVKPCHSPTTDHHTAFVIQVLDFNPYSVGRELAAEAEAASGDTELVTATEALSLGEPSKAKSKRKVVTKSTEISGHAFKRSVTTSLPYVEITAAQDPKHILTDFTGLMIVSGSLL